MAGNGLQPLHRPGTTPETVRYAMRTLQGYQARHLIVGYAPRTQGAHHSPGAMVRNAYPTRLYRVSRSTLAMRNHSILTHMTTDKDTCARASPTIHLITSNLSSTRFALVANGVATDSESASCCASAMALAWASGTPAALQPACAHGRPIAQLCRAG